MLRLAAALRAARRPVATLRLHTITFSHYVEKVRWCLDRLGVRVRGSRRTPGYSASCSRAARCPALEVALRRDAHRRLAAHPALPVGRVLAAACRPSARGSSNPRRPRSNSRQVRPPTRQRRARLGVFADLQGPRRSRCATWGIEETSIPGWQRLLLYTGTPLLRFAVRAHARRHAGACRTRARADARGVRRGGQPARRRAPLPDRGRR